MNDLISLRKNEADVASEAFEDIARNTKYLKAKDISNTIKIAKEETERAIDWGRDDEPSVKSFAVYSVRVLASWTGQALAKAADIKTPHQKESSAPSTRL